MADTIAEIIRDEVKAALAEMRAGIVADVVALLDDRLPAQHAPNDVVKAREAATRLGVTPRTLQRYVRLGRIRPIAAGPHAPRFYRVSDLDALLRYRD